MSSALDVKNRKLKFGWLCPLLLASTLVQGQELDDTLRKIQRTGSITFGFHPQSFPLSYLDDQKNAVGYTLDLAAQIASAIKQHLKVSKLEIKRSTITLQNRFEQVSRGVVDLECNVTTNTTDRQKQFAFSNTFFVATTRLLTRQNSNIKDFTDLSGHRALVFGNTTTEHLLRKFSSEKKVPFEVVVTMDLSTPPIIQLQSGQVDAYMGDDIVLYGYIVNSARPQDWIVTGTALSREAYGCVMRKDSPRFKAIVDAAIADWMRSGQAAMSYKKWFQSPTPPDGINLNFPMSSDMEYLFRNPNDRAFD